MPYFSIKDLPKVIQRILPKPAQEIYRKAFNRVWDAFYKVHPKKRESRVRLAAMAAWMRVKEKYKKVNKRWVRKKGK